jgi:hypothetical protein
MAKKNTENIEEEVLTGSNKVKQLQEKQVVNLNKVHDSLVRTFEKIHSDYQKSIEESREELLNVYYDIQNKEEYLKELEESRMDSLNKKLQDGNIRYTQLVEEKQAKISELDKLYKVKKDDFDVDFNLKLKADKKATMESLLKEFSMAYISSADLEELKLDFQNLKQTYEAGYEEAVKTAEQKTIRKYEAQLKAQKLTFEKDQAEMAAEIKALRAQITRMEEDLDKAEARLHNVLENQVRMAEASKSVVVNAGKDK